MKDFLFVYKADYANMPKGTAEEREAMTKRWMDWIGGIAAQNKLTDRGNRLAIGGKIVKSPSVVTDGPYTEIKELLGGYSVVKASSLDEAAEMAKGCPIFSQGGVVEVREIENL